MLTIHVRESASYFCAKNLILSVEEIVTYYGGLDPLVANDFNFI